jgi:hypothetical protein
VLAGPIDSATLCLRPAATTLIKFIKSTQQHCHGNEYTRDSTTAVGRGGLYAVRVVSDTQYDAKGKSRSRPRFETRDCSWNKLKCRSENDSASEFQQQFADVLCDWFFLEVLGNFRTSRGGPAIALAPCCGAAAQSLGHLSARFVTD